MKSKQYGRRAKNGYAEALHVARVSHNLTLRELCDSAKVNTATFLQYLAVKRKKPDWIGRVEQILELSESEWLALVPIPVDKPKTVPSNQPPRSSSDLIDDIWRRTDGKLPKETIGAFLREACGQLTGRLKEVVRLRYGLDDIDKPQTWRNIGQVFGVTKERARQINYQALTKLAVKILDYTRALERQTPNAFPGGASDNGIEVLGLDIRPYNCLKRAGINNLEQLTLLTFTELVSIRNLGKKSASGVQDALSARGLALRSMDD